MTFYTRKGDDGSTGLLYGGRVAKDDVRPEAGGAVDEAQAAIGAARAEAARGGELDELLVYRKGLRKDLEGYTATTPPHVAAARKSTEQKGRLIAYVMTTAGPEPLDRLEHEPDREHYVEKQIQPVAEPVLRALGLEFERVIGDDRQLGLFQ
jgi:DNA polymerase elongation subunit (family B)